ncbi:pyridoxamine 5'-phosphate oxidase family protein [Amycolatopsis sp. NPDC049253]|uniref:pyridoxamine 5'-phosphate oxidase family protein n=1 Tax=Amycolatopsis sp. NPDC049253 TaxID=3155274 RepID=UPI0034406005
MEGVHRARYPHRRAGHRTGGPHIAPVWFLLDGDDLVFTTENVTAKAHDLARNGRAAMCIDDEVPPYPTRCCGDTRNLRRLGTVA